MAPAGEFLNLVTHSGSGSFAVRHAGSSPASRTIFQLKTAVFPRFFSVCPFFASSAGSCRFTKGKGCSQLGLHDGLVNLIFCTKKDARMNRTSKNGLVELAGGDQFSAGASFAGAKSLIFAVFSMASSSVLLSSAWAFSAARNSVILSLSFSSGVTSSGFRSISLMMW